MKITSRLVHRFDDLTLAGEVFQQLQSEYKGNVTLVQSRKGTDMRVPIGTSTAVYAAIRGFVAGYMNAREKYLGDVPVLEAIAW